jgi:hypothetical protein
MGLGGPRDESVQRSAGLRSQDLVSRGLVLVMVCLAAACSSASKGASPKASSAPSDALHPAPASTASRVRPSKSARLSALVPCTTAAMTGTPLKVATGTVATIDRPFGVVTTSDGRWSFVSIAGVTQLMSDRSFVPTFVRSVPVPNGLSGAGEALSSDGRYLLVAAGSGAVVIDVGAGPARSRSHSHATTTTCS